MRTEEFKKGDRVISIEERFDKKYPGVITACGKKTFRFKYDDEKLGETIHYHRNTCKSNYYMAFQKVTSPRYGERNLIKEKKYNEMISTAFHRYGNTTAFTNFCGKHIYTDVTIESIDYTTKDLNTQLEELDMGGA